MLAGSLSTAVAFFWCYDRGIIAVVLYDQYAEAYGAVYRRIEAVADVNGTLRVLDLTDAKVRKAVAEAEDIKGLYAGILARDY
jgi:hypothetical protein